jgi:hypothetical protein
VSFQPASFTGRDEEITPERRAAQRYTLSHLAHNSLSDVLNRAGLPRANRSLAIRAALLILARSPVGARSSRERPPRASCH